ncbi:MAG: HDOD domain-containing protein [Deltaproteobacteria bacterium]|nr:HDOD domain-containing protein [Deltaproteobacteria bacterium]
MITPALRQPPTLDIPTLPGVASRLLHAYGSDDVRIPDLVHALEGDPGISSRLLRLANSPYYGFPRKIATLERAVWLLGRATVAAVALATTIFRQIGGAVAPEAEALWTGAYRSALGCRYLARKLPASPWRSSPDSLFLTGLLHDVGMILFLAREPELYLDLLRASRSVPEVVEAERAAFGQDHAALTGEAMEIWNFPVGMVSVCRHHHGGGLRTELLPDWEILAAVDCALSGEHPVQPLPTLSEGLLEDLERYLESVRAEAEGFFRALS